MDCSVEILSHSARAQSKRSGWQYWQRRMSLVPEPFEIDGVSARSIWTASTALRISFAAIKRARVSLAGVAIARRSRSARVSALRGARRLRRRGRLLSHSFERVPGRPDISRSWRRASFNRSRTGAKPCRLAGHKKPAIRRGGHSKPAAPEYPPPRERASLGRPVASGFNLP